MDIPHLFTHSLVDGHLGILLAIMNNVAMNICVQVFGWTHVFISLVSIPRSGVLDQMVAMYLTF